MVNKYYRKQNVNGKQILTEDKLKSTKTVKKKHKYKPEMDVDVSKARSYKKGGKVYGWQKI